MEGAALRQVLVDSLLKQIEDETFPSVTMMNRVEAALRTREQVEDYVKTLLSKVTSTQYPSISMLDRIEGLLATLD